MKQTQILTEIPKDTYETHTHSQICHLHPLTHALPTNDSLDNDDDNGRLEAEAMMMTKTTTMIMTMIMMILVVVVVLVFIIFSSITL